MPSMASTCCCTDAHVDLRRSCTFFLLMVLRRTKRSAPTTPAATTPSDVVSSLVLPEMPGTNAVVVGDSLVVVSSVPVVVLPSNVVVGCAVVLNRARLSSATVTEKAVVTPTVVRYPVCCCSTALNRATSSVSTLVSCSCRAMEAAATASRRRRLNASTSTSGTVYVLGRRMANVTSVEPSVTGSTSITSSALSNPNADAALQTAQKENRRSK